MREDVRQQVGPLLLAAESATATVVERVNAVTKTEAKYVCRPLRRCQPLKLNPPAPPPSSPQVLPFHRDRARGAAW